MNFEQFRAKVFHVFILGEMNTESSKKAQKDLIDEIKKHFGVVELKGIKILSESI